MPDFAWAASNGDSKNFFGAGSGFLAEPRAELADPPLPLPALPPVPLLLLVFLLLLHAPSITDPATIADPYKKLRRETPFRCCTELLGLIWILSMHSLGL